MPNPSVTIALNLATQGLTAQANAIKGSLQASFKGFGIKTPTGLTAALAVAKQLTGALLRTAAAAAKLGAVFAAGVGAAGHFASAASNSWERAQWKFDIIFQDISKAANKSAKSIADTFKVNIASVQSSMAKIGDVTKPIGMQPKMLLEMSTSLEKLAQGAVEWTEGRYDASRASTAFMKALVGEKEMLKEFGVVINDAEIFAAIKDAGKAVTPLNRAIVTYNLVLARTADLQKAAFDRIGTFSSRFTQFKQSILNVSSAIGDFVKPIATELYNLFAVINRKVAELLRDGGMEEFKTLSEDIAESIKRISDRISTIDLSTLTKDLATIKKGLATLAIGTMDVLVNMFIAGAKSLASIISAAVVSGITDGWQLAMDSIATKAGVDEILATLPKHPSFKDNPLIQLVGERAQKRLDERRERGGRSFREISGDFRKEAAKGALDLKTLINKIADTFETLGGGKAAKQPKAPGAIGTEQALTGPDVDPFTPKKRLQLRRINLRISDLKKKLRGEREGTLDPEVVRFKEDIARAEEDAFKEKLMPFNQNRRSAERIRGNLRSEISHLEGRISRRQKSEPGKGFLRQDRMKFLQDELRDLTSTTGISDEERRRRREGMQEELRGLRQQGKGGAATIGGLTDAYTSMLSRAAGQRAPEEEVAANTSKTNDLLDKLVTAETEKKNLLMSIETNTAKPSPDGTFD